MLGGLNVFILQTNQKLSTNLLIVAFAPLKSPRARCAQSNILAQVLNQCVVYLERRVEPLAVCMPQLNNTCAYFYAKDLTLNAGRQRLRCAWAITYLTQLSTEEFLIDRVHRR